jgi:hypothetical protein
MQISRGLVYKSRVVREKVPAHGPLCRVKITQFGVPTPAATDRCIPILFVPENGLWAELEWEDVATRLAIGPFSRGIDRCPKKSRISGTSSPNAFADLSEFGDAVAGKTTDGVKF